MMSNDKRSELRDRDLAFYDDHSMTEVTWKADFHYLLKWGLPAACAAVSYRLSTNQRGHLVFQRKCDL